MTQSHRCGFAAVLFVLAASACTQDATMSGPESDPAAVAQSLARAIAVGMADADVRMGVRDALRASLVVEHKVDLRQFLTTPTG
jgi:hypothetical protein